MELDDDVEFHHREKLYHDKLGYAKMPRCHLAILARWILASGRTMTTIFMTLPALSDGLFMDHMGHIYSAGPKVSKKY